MTPIPERWKDIYATACMWARPANPKLVDTQMKTVIEELGRAEQELEQWKTWGVVEIAVRNPNVASYMEHWEARATKAEQERDTFRWAVGAKDKQLLEFSDFIDQRNRELAGARARVERLSAMIPLDACEVCHGAKGGVAGNENIVDGIVMCDYCHAASHEAGK